MVENDTIKLPPGIHLPDGTPVRLDLSNEGAVSSQWSASYFARTAGALADEPMERPAQGELPSREFLE